VAIDKGEYMQTVTLLEDCSLALDGQTITQHKKGDTLDVSDRLASILYNSGRLKKAGNKAKKPSEKPVGAKNRETRKP